MSDSAEDNVDEILGMDPGVIALLKEEYLHLQKTVEDFDQRTLTIKAWSVTTSMAGIAASSKSQNRLLQIEPSAKKAKHFCSKDN